MRIETNFQGAADAAPNGQQFTPAGLKVFGGFFTAILALIGLIGGVFLCWPQNIYENGKLAGRSSPWLGVVVLAAGVALAALAYWLSRSGVRGLADRPAAGLEQVTGPLPQLGSPVPAAAVVKALERLNGLALPYRVDSSPGQDSQIEVIVRWRVEEAQWQTLLHVGSASKTWVMRVRLSPDGRYRFRESQAAVSAEAGPAHVSGAKTWSWGKSFGALNATRVWTPLGAAKGPAAAAADSAVVAVRPSDAKIPVFAILRAYGWRPPHDSWVSRIWEY
ncbi:MAG: hypothetical protein LBI84_05710 [Propionibacteriaceae bacterium]|jgi:hypothetical protein|nr:hypothetical protein [Propionibacteriaceae bacterium]